MVTCPNCRRALCTCDVIGDERLSIGEIAFGLVFGIAWVLAFLACVLA